MVSVHPHRVRPCSAHALVALVHQAASVVLLLYLFCWSRMPSWLLVPGCRPRSTG